MRTASNLIVKQLPLDLIVWGAIGIALNVGLARFTYGVMQPSIRRDLALDYLGSGNLNAVHLAGYLIGTLAAPFARGQLLLHGLKLRENSQDHIDHAGA